MLEFDDEISERLGLSPDFSTDSNNNSNSDSSDKTVHHSHGDKYSLRPRSSRKRNLNDDFEEIITIPSKSTKPRQPKPKQKPAPLSKYRRKTANARERTRMREINTAFETLRKVVPQMTITHHQTNEKLTKITTLRLAMKYISTLSAALTDNLQDCSNIQQDFLSDCSELDCFLLESDGESLPLHSDLSDNSVTPADFAIDFPDDSLTSVDFSCPLSPDLSNHLTQFDPFLSGFS